jgi:hypothetical protein
MLAKGGMVELSHVEHSRSLKIFSAPVLKNSALGGLYASSVPFLFIYWCMQPSPFPKIKPFSPKNSLLTEIKFFYFHQATIKTNPG